jgi:AraC-like DNA-binding protein
MKNGLGRAAIRSLAQGGRYLLGSQAKALREKQQACEAELKKQFSHIDEDIASQLHYAREKFLQLEQLHFKLSCDPEKKEIQHQMLQYAADICIKLRHLLDQSFTRLIHAHIYVPNNKWVEIHIKTTIKFYAYASLKDLNDDLMKKEIIHTGSEKVSLSLDYPEVYQLLIEAQPFTAGEDSQWLKDLIMLSNQAKHIGLLSLETTSDKNTTETLIQRMALCKKALIQTEKIIQAIYKAISLRSQQAFLSEEKEKARDLKPVEEKKRAEEVKDMTLIKMPQGMVLAPASYAASQVMFFKKLSDQEFIKRRHNNAAEQRKYDQIFGLIVR